MQTRKFLRMTMLMAAIAGLIAAAEVGAQLVPIEPQRSCTAGSQATIVAGPDQFGNPTAEFPRLVNCPGDCPGAVFLGTNTPLVGPFLAWEFKWTQIGKSPPSQFGLQVASDVPIEGSSPAVSSISAPGQEDSSLKLGANDWDSRWLRFANINSSSSLTATYYTQTNFALRPEAAASRSGSNTSSCLLAGAGKIAVDAFKPVPATQTVVCAAGKCTCTLSFDAAGNITAVTSPDCDVDTAVLTIDGKPVTFIPNEGITIGTGTSTCFPTRPTASCVCIAKPCP